MLITHITKLILEIKLPWEKCLPKALLRIRVASGKDLRLSLIDGFSYLSWPVDLPIMETTLWSFKESYNGHLFYFLHSRTKRKTQILPFKFTAQQLQSGEVVLIKTWKDNKLQLSWEGPYQLHIASKMTTRTGENIWTQCAGVMRLQNKLCKRCGSD